MKTDCMSKCGGCDPQENVSYQEKVKAEKAELEEKIEKLTQLLTKGPKESGIPPVSFDLLHEQLAAMIEYSCILNKRILYWGM